MSHIKRSSSEELKISQQTSYIDSILLALSAIFSVFKDLPKLELTTLADLRNRKPLEWLMEGDLSPNYLPA